MRLLPMALVASVLAGCARDVRTSIPSAPGAAGEPTGTITIVLTRPCPDVLVAVNGALVVRGAHTARIRIDRVPSGYADVAIAMGPGEKQVRVWVEPDGDTVLPLGSPGGSAGDSLRNLAMSLAAMALYAWIR
jgi:hypothetical protein